MKPVVFTKFVADQFRSKAAQARAFFFLFSSPSLFLLYFSLLRLQILCSSSIFLSFSLQYVQSF